MYYQLRLRDEILADLRALELRKKKVEQEYRIAMADIMTDADVIKSELALLKSLGKTD